MPSGGGMEEGDLVLLLAEAGLADRSLGVVGVRGGGMEGGREGGGREGGGRGGGREGGREGGGRREGERDEERESGRQSGRERGGDTGKEQCTDKYVAISSCACMHTCLHSNIQMYTSEVR